MENGDQYQSSTTYLPYRFSFSINQLSHFPTYCICRQLPFQKLSASVLYNLTTNKTNFWPWCIPKQIYDLCEFENIYDDVQHLGSLLPLSQAQTSWEMLDYYPYVTLVANPFDESVSTSIFLGNSHSNISMSCTCIILCVDAWRNDKVSIQKANWSGCVSCYLKFDKYEQEDQITMTFGQRFHVNSRLVRLKSKKK